MANYGLSGGLFDPSGNLIQTGAPQAVSTIPGSTGLFDEYGNLIGGPNQGKKPQQAAQVTHPVAQPQQNVFDKAVSFIKSIPQAFQYQAQPEIQQKPPAMDAQAKATQAKILEAAGGKTTVNIKDMPGIIKNIPKEVAQTKVKESLIGGAKALPGQFEQGGGIILSSVLDMNKFMDSYTTAPLRKIGIMPTYEIDKQARKSVEDFALRLREKGVKDLKQAREEYAKVYKPSPGIAGSLESVLYNVPQVGANIGLSMATLAVTKNPALAAAVGIPTSYALNSAEIYDEARNYGLSDSQSLPMAQVGGIGMSILDNIPVVNLINKSVGRVVLKEAEQEIIKKSLLQNFKRVMIDTAMQAGSEGITEGMQTILQNAIAKTYNDNKQLLEGVPESIFVGALLGAGSDVTMAGVDTLIGAVQNGKVEKILQKALETPKEKRTQEQQQLIDAITTQEMTPDNAIQYVTDNGLGKTPEGKAIVLEAIKAKDAGNNLRIALAPDEKTAEITQVKPGEGIPSPTTQEAVKAGVQPQKVGEVVAGEGGGVVAGKEQGKVWYSGSETEKPSGKYLYLTPDEKYASEFGKNISKYSFTPENSIDMTSLGQKKITFSKLQSFLKENGITIDKTMVDENYRTGVSEPAWFWLRRYQNITDEIAKSGKDAILLKESIEKGKTTDSAIVLNKNITSDITTSQPSASTIESKAQTTPVKTDLQIKESKGLNEEEKKVEQDFAEYLQNNYDEARKRYKEAFGNVINTDNARELSKDYAPDGINSKTQKTKDARSKYAAAVHEPASAFMRKMYADDLAEIVAKGKKPNVFFSAGGTGAGKSTGIENIESIKALQGDADIVYDTNLNKFASSTEKIDQALNAGAKVNIAFVHRNVIDAFVNGALPRAERMGRTVPLEEHINTHVQSPENIVNLVKHYDKNKAVNILFVDNSLGRGNAKETTLDITEQAKYNIDETRKALLDELQKAYENGSISKAVYEGTRGNNNIAVRQGDLQGSIREGTQDNGGPTQQPQQPREATGEVKLQEKPLTKAEKSKIQYYGQKEKKIVGRVENVDQGIGEAIRGAKTQEGMIQALDKYVEQYKVEADQRNMADLRAGLVKEISNLIGSSGKGYKADYALRVAMRDNPDVGELVKQLEYHISNIDDTIKSYPERVLTQGEQIAGTQKGAGMGPQLPAAGTVGGKAESRLQERLQEQLLSLDQGKYEFDEKSGKYNKVVLESDAKKAVDFMESDPEKALKVAKGLEAAPDGIMQNSISMAVALKARDEGNYELWKNLVTTTSLRSTRYGQEIVSLRGQFNDDSPENFIKRALSAKMEKLGGGIMTEAEKLLARIQGKSVSTKTKAIDRIDKETEILSKRLRQEQKKIQLAQDIINSLICK